MPSMCRPSRSWLFVVRPGTSVGLFGRLSGFFAGLPALGAGCPPAHVAALSVPFFLSCLGAAGMLQTTASRSSPAAAGSRSPKQFFPANGAAASWSADLVAKSAAGRALAKVSRGVVLPTTGFKTWQAQPARLNAGPALPPAAPVSRVLGFAQQSTTGRQAASTLSTWLL